jgi:ATPase subunit of ABC transporter with duplicated ATPase domains
MLTLSGLSMRFGANVLFEDASWQLQPGGHYGLVGANGSGKSTLLKLMGGQLAPETGTIAMPNAVRLGMLQQDQARFDASPLLDVVLMGKPLLWKALREKEELLARGAGAAGDGGGGDADPDDAAGHRLAELEAIIGDQGGYSAEAVAARMLAGLGLVEERHRRLMGELSGGFRLRVLLAQTLFMEPELLLLDEPTNHLDLLSIRWLEGHLRAFPGTFVVVSHDRHFLNSICDSIADIDYGELTVYPGGYDAFEAAKTLAQEQKEAEIARVEEKIADTQKFIDRFKAKASKARQAQSRKKQLERIEIPEIKRSSRRWPRFAFVPKRASGKEVLTVSGLGKTYDSRPVLKNVNFALERGERVAVVGPNGVGKSTLLKIVAGQLTPDQGKTVPGYEVHLGYFAQDHHEVLKGRVTLYDWLAAIAPREDVGTVRGILGRMLFSGDDALKRVSALSGGEAARLLLGGLMLRKDNLLVLDEPTNHLDLEGREALMKALKEYPGTLLFVSHDRHFVSSVAGRVLAITPEGLEDFVGSYEDYLAREGADFLSSDPASLRAPRAVALAGGAPAASAASNEFHDRKARKKEAARLRKLVERLEDRIASLERTVAETDQRFAQPEYFQATPWNRVQQEQQARAEQAQALQAVIKEWEAATANLEAIQEAS